MSVLSLPAELLQGLAQALRDTPAHVLLLALLGLAILGILAIYVTLHIVAPKPRAPFPSEKTYVTSDPSGATMTRQLPCWYDRWHSERRLHEAENQTSATGISDIGVAAAGPEIEPAEVEMSVVIPAYNEEKRILPMLEEVVEYCDQRFGRPRPAQGAVKSSQGSNKKGEKGSSVVASPTTPTTPTGTHKRHHHHVAAFASADGSSGSDGAPSGYEIIIVNDGSRDGTAQVALDFARRHGLHDVLRVVTLERNRGKGGGVTHGLRHVRGAYAVFADADGASRFSDLGRLMEGCDDVLDGSGRGVAIGSRAHLVGSEAVVKRSALRNFLMKSFHFVLTILTPPATSRIRDTQCGFKLFSRAALPHIVPYMHAEGWIFDIEMLMLAESAPATPVLASDGVTAIGSSPGIRVAEVPVAWHEVDGSKMSLVQDSLRMAVGLGVLRASWMMGVYRRRLPPL